jgi:very-short-patch-repair endonuclease
MHLTKTGKRARELRNTMTGPEVILWSRLKTLRSEGFHIRRQAPFRGYVLDFVCFDRKLVIEVDGGQHGEDDRAARDAVRDAVLQREGFQVLRFWNRSVRENLEGVMYSIRDALGAPPPFPPRSRRRRESPSPEGEGKEIR